jgi:hypothetical protein
VEGGWSVVEGGFGSLVSMLDVGGSAGLELSEGGEMVDASGFEALDAVVSGGVTDGLVEGGIAEEVDGGTLSVGPIEGSFGGADERVSSLTVTEDGRLLNPVVDGGRVDSEGATLSAGGLLGFTGGDGGVVASVGFAVEGGLARASEEATIDVASGVRRDSEGDNTSEGVDGLAGAPVAEGTVAGGLLSSPALADANGGAESEFEGGVGTLEGATVATRLAADSLANDAGTPDGAGLLGTGVPGTDPVGGGVIGGFDGATVALGPIL